MKSIRSNFDDGNKLVFLILWWLSKRYDKCPLWPLSHISYSWWPFWAFSAEIFRLSNKEQSKEDTFFLEFLKKRFWKTCLSLSLSIYIYIYIYIYISHAHPHPHTYMRNIFIWILGRYINNTHTHLHSHSHGRKHSGVVSKDLYKYIVVIEFKFQSIDYVHYIYIYIYIYIFKIWYLMSPGLPLSIKSVPYTSL